MVEKLIELMQQTLNRPLNKEKKTKEKLILIDSEHLDPMGRTSDFEWISPFDHDAPERKDWDNSDLI